MDKQILKQILRDNQQEVERYVVEPREFVLDDFPCRVFVGVRRTGKSYMLYHYIQQLLAAGHKWDEMLYLNFEDERLEKMSVWRTLILRISTNCWNVIRRCTASAPCCFLTKCRT